MKKFNLFAYLNQRWSECYFIWHKATLPGKYHDGCGQMKLSMQVLPLPFILCIPFHFLLTILKDIPFHNILSSMKNLNLW